MDFYGKYVEMCNEVGKSPSAVAIEIGLSKPSVNRWKNGGSPTDATARKIASYFGVSVGYLLGEEEDKKEKLTDNDELSEADKKFRELLKDATEDEKQMYYDIIQTIIDRRK